MSGETITVTIDETGETQIEVGGVVGKSCTDLTKGLENALGKVDSRGVKPEYHRQDVNQKGGQHAKQ